MGDRKGLTWLALGLLVALTPPTACGGSAVEDPQQSGASGAGASPNGGTGGTRTDAAPGGAGSGGAPNDSGSTVRCTPDGTQLSGGYVRCEEGFLHRPEVGECPLPTERVACDPSIHANRGCSTDDDCFHNPNGYCEPAALSGECFCRYPCARDADCPAGFVCFCDDPGEPVVGRCVAGKCASDADCTGTLCASSSSPGGGTVFACLSPNDDCRVDSDCGPAEICALTVDEVRSCAPAGVGATGG
jgi:Cys-rich repeat protein